MAVTKNCPRCGTALKVAGDRFVCPSCRVSLVRKTKGDSASSSIQETPSVPPPLPASALDFMVQAVALPPKKSAAPQLVKNAVLAGAALFLLLGTVLTGYAFALTFSTPVETAKQPEPVVEPPKPAPPPPAPPKDWRVTLSNLRQLVVTPPTALTETPEPAKPPRVLRLAVSDPPMYDDMGKQLASLGKGYTYTKLNERELHKTERLSEFDVLFLTCNQDKIPERLTHSLREFVRLGGTLYASDLRYDAVRASFPEFADPVNAGQGERQDIEAEVTDAGLRDVLGPSVRLHFDARGWRPAAFKEQLVTTLLRGEYVSVNGRAKPKSAPLLVKFSFQKGNVIFTSFHNAKINSETADKLLRYLVFSAVTAEVQTKVTKLMVKGGYSQQKQNLLSASASNSKVNQQYDHKQTGALKAILGFENQGARLRLTMTGPNGERHEREGRETFTIDVPDAAAGEWTYTVTALHVPFPNFPFTVTLGAATPKQ